MKSFNSITVVVSLAFMVSACSGRDLNACRPEAGIPSEHGCDEDLEAQRFQACPSTSSTCSPGGNPDGDPEIRMPTTLNLSKSQVRSRLGSEGYMKEALFGTNYERWSYCAERCQDGNSWCLSQTTACTPYSIIFFSGYINSTYAWVRLDVGMRNASSLSRTCKTFFSYENWGQVSSASPIWMMLSAGQRQTAGAWVAPGSYVTLKAYCHDTSSLTVGYAERMQSITVNSDTAWNSTYGIGLNGPVVE